MLATVVVLAGGATVALTAAETPGQPAGMRAGIALKAAESTLRLIKPARRWTRLASVPVRERRLIGSYCDGKRRPESRRTREAPVARDDMGHQGDTANDPGLRPLSAAPGRDSAGGIELRHLVCAARPDRAEHEHGNRTPLQTRTLEGGIHGPSGQRRATSPSPDGVHRAGDARSIRDPLGRRRRLGGSPAQLLAPRRRHSRDHDHKHVPDFPPRRPKPDGRLQSVARARTRRTRQRDTDLRRQRRSVQLPSRRSREKPREPSRSSSVNSQARLQLRRSKANPTHAATASYPSSPCQDILRSN